MPYSQIEYRGGSYGLIYLPLGGDFDSNNVVPRESVAVIFFHSSKHINKSCTERRHILTGTEWDLAHSAGQDGIDLYIKPFGSTLTR